MNKITSINDARLLGIPEACKRAFPASANVPAGEKIKALFIERNTCANEQVAIIDRHIIDICLSIPLPSSAEWEKMGRLDYSGRYIQEHLRGVLYYAGITGAVAASIIGIDARTFRRYVQQEGQNGYKIMPYSAWYTLLTNVRGGQQHDA